MEANNTSFPGLPLPSLSTTQNAAQNNSSRLLPPPTFAAPNPASSNDQELPIPFLEDHKKRLLRRLSGMSREDRSRAVLEAELKGVNTQLAERRRPAAGMFGGWGAAASSGANGDAGRKRARENTSAGGQGRPKAARKGMWGSPPRQGTGGDLGLQESGGGSSDEYSDGGIDWTTVMANDPTMAAFGGSTENNGLGALNEDMFEDLVDLTDGSPDTVYSIPSTGSNPSVQSLPGSPMSVRPSLAPPQPSFSSFQSFLPPPLSNPLFPQRNIAPRPSGLGSSDFFMNFPRQQQTIDDYDSEGEGSEIEFLGTNPISNRLAQTGSGMSSRQPFSGNLPPIQPSMGRFFQNTPSIPASGFTNFGRFSNTGPINTSGPLSTRRTTPSLVPHPSDDDYRERTAFLNRFAGFGTATAPFDLEAEGLLPRPLNDGWETPPPSSADYYRLNSYANYVRNDPTKTVEEIKSLLENIRPDMEIPPENREGTPDAMVYPLMEHQKIGLAWLKAAEEGKTKGGILADDMGLGKTIQTLALLVSRKSNDPECRTTLIVAPVALLKQWEREIQKKLKPEDEHKLSTYIYHGGTSRKAQKKWEDLAKFDVVLTTYGTIASEFKRREKEDVVEEGAEARPPQTLLLSPEAQFYRVILDEAQCIKNRDTQSSKGCAALKARYRLCLSGTPMQNSCDELFPLLRFLRVKPWDSWTQFAHAFSRPLRGTSGNADGAMKKLQALLRVVLLRRTKESKIDGKPILSLPDKEITMVEAEFSDDEMEFYKSIEMKSKIVFNKYVQKNAIGKNYSAILVLLLRLRQACCHPHLINHFEQEQTKSDLNAMRKLAEELSESAVTRIKEHAAQECPVCLDMSPNPQIIIPCGHMFCEECLIGVQDQHRQQCENRGVSPKDNKASCPGCRGDIDPDKVIDLRAFKKVHHTEDDTTEIDNIFDDHIDDGLIYDTDDDEVDANGDLKDFIVNDESTTPEAVNAPAAEAANPDPVNKGKKPRGPGKTLAEVRKEASKNEKSRRKYLKHLSARWIDSSKVTKCMSLINNITNTCPQEKIIIFSQFTSLLDLLEVPLSRSNPAIQYRRYDGSMSTAKRNQALLDFTDNPDIKILLISIKAGNSGLNLVAANHVIIFDPFYNPFVELQAIDRAHRIGQQKKVTVHRLVVRGTVEDRVLALQEEKRALIEGALDEGAQRGMGRLSARDLGFLFGINS